MTGDRTRHHVTERAAHHVQSGAANRARRQAHQRVGRLLKLGRRNIVETNLDDAVKDYCLHPHLLSITHHSGRSWRDTTRL
jgi:hypothetical protein